MAAPVFGAGSAEGANSSSYTISLTPANSNKVMYAFLYRQDTTAPTSVVFNTSESLTQIASGSFDTAARGWWLYRLIAPSSTTANVVGTFAGATNGSMAAFWYYDTDQTTPNDAADEAEGSGTAAQNTVTSEAGDTCIALLGHTSTSTKAPASGETEHIDVSTLSAGLYELAGGASLSFDITLGTSRPWVLVGLNLNAVAGGVTTEQEGFRWRADDGNETTASWLATQDTNITRAVSTNTRLRVIIATTGDAPSQTYTLQYRKVGDAASEWENV